VRAEYVGLIPVSTPLSLASGQHATVDFNLAAAPFYDDAEMDRGWTLGAPGDDATQGIWVRAVPIATFNGSVPAQPGADHTPGAGTTCFVTGNTNNAFTSSVNGGKTTLICPTLDLSGVTDPRIVFWRYYYHNHLIGGDLALSQPFLTEISNDGGASWTTVSQTQRSIGAWERIEIRVTDFFAAPGSVRVRFVAQNRVGGITEALIDDFEYYSGAGSAALALPPRAASVVTAPNIALRRGSWTSRGDLSPRSTREPCRQGSVSFGGTGGPRQGLRDRESISSEWIPRATLEPVNSSGSARALVVMPTHRTRT
jgi:hypothetical protein